MKQRFNLFQTQGILSRVSRACRESVGRLSTLLFLILLGLGFSSQAWADEGYIYVCANSVFGNENSVSINYEKNSGGWSGVKTMTETGFKYDGHKVYGYKMDVNPNTGVKTLQFVQGDNYYGAGSWGNSKDHMYHGYKDKAHKWTDLPSTSNAKAVYLVGSFNGWVNEDANYAFTKIDGNHWTGTFILDGASSNYQFKVYAIDNAMNVGYQVSGNGYWFNDSNNKVEQLWTNNDNDQIVCPASSGKFRIEVEYYGNYSNHGQLKVTRAVVRTLSYAKGNQSATGTDPASQLLANGDKITLPANPYTLTGYDFAGWNDGSNTYAADAEYTMGSSAVTLTAQWTAKTYDVTLSKNNSDASGSTDGSGTVTFGAKSISATNFVAPTRYGYHVYGAYYQEQGLTNCIAGADRSLKNSTAYTTSDGAWNYDGNVTLYTRWVGDKYNVAYNGYGNTGGSMSMQENITYGAGTKLTQNAFVKTGHTFQGWSTSEGGAKAYDDKQSADALYTAANCTTQVYAVWTPNVNTIVFNANTGSGDQMTNQTFTYGETAKALSANTYAKTGYHFIGWARTAAGDVEYTDGQVISNITTATETINLYAKWEPNVTNITVYRNYNNEDATTEAAVTAYYDCTIGQVTGLPNSGYSRTGYNHNGLYLARSGGSYLMRYNDGWAFNSTTQSGYCTATYWKYAAGGALTLYSQWSAKTYNITFNTNGGTTESFNRTFTYDAVPAASGVPTHATNNFAGYAIGSAEGTLLYNAAGQLIYPVQYYTDASGKWIWDGAITLVARWMSNYTITLDGDGATTAGTTSVDVNPKTTILTSIAEVPTKTGYTFGGYYTDKNGGGTQLITDQGAWIKPIAGYIDGDGKWIKGSNATLYAKWTVNVTNLSFDKQGGTGGANSRTLTYNSITNMDNIDCPTREGYTFEGYYTEAEGAGTKLITNVGAWLPNVDGYTGELSNNKPKWMRPTAGALTLYANWTENIYDLQITHKYYQLNGSSVINAYTVDDPTIEDIIGIATTYTIDASSAAKPGFYHTKWTVPSGNIKYNTKTYKSGTDLSTKDLVILENANGWQTSGTAAIQMQDRWREYERTLDVFANNGTIQGDTADLEGIGVYTAKTVVAIANPGYKFNEWIIAPTSANYSINLDTTSATTPVRVSSDVKTNKSKAGSITANFTPITYKITYANMEGATNFQDAPATYNIESATISLGTPTKTGYTFTGWKRTNAGGDVITEIAQGSTGDTTLWATWSEDMHTVYIVGSTEGSASAGIATTGSATADAAPTGQEFDEWEIPSSEHFKLVDCEITDETIYFNATAGEMVVTAKYIDTDYKLEMIVLPAGKGTTVPTTDTIIHYDSPFDIKAIPNRGYEFVNWVSSEHGGKADIDFTASVGGASVSARKTGIVISNDAAGAKTGNARLVNPNDAILTANFQIINYTIKYNTNGGTEVADGSYTVESETFALPTTTRTGFAFAGWYNNDKFTGSAITQITKGSIGDTVFYAKWETTHVYLEGRARVKNAEGVETTINPDAEWVQTLKTIPFTFNSTDSVYYLNTYCTVLEQAANVGTGSNYIRMGIANGDGAVTPYGCNTAEDYIFTPDAKGSVVGATNGDVNNKSFKFRDVEKYENDNFKRRYPVMYRYNPTTNMFDYCAPLLTLNYTGKTATMTGLAIVKDSAKLTVDGLNDSTITYQYKQGEGDWTEWTSDLTAAAGTYKLRATASGNNEFGQPVMGVVSNEITVTVTTPAVSAQVTHVNANPGSIIRVNDSFTIKHTLTGVPAGQSVKVCYHWSQKPDSSAIEHDIFTPVKDDQTSVWTSIDVAGDYEIEISVSTLTCDQSGQPTYIKWDTYTLPIHVKGDEITVYARLDKGITDWNKKYVYYWHNAAGTWPGYEMSYIGKDSTDYEWYSYNITGYKEFAGGKLLFNDSTTRYGQYQTNNVDMPTDDEFYFIKTAMTNGKRDVALDPHIDVTKRVILTTDTTALYQYVTIELEGKGVFFANREEMEYTYSIDTKPAGSTATLNAKHQFTPDKAGDYTISIRCDAGSLNSTNTFVLHVKPNPLTLKAYKSSAEITQASINDQITVTVSSTQALSGTKTFTVIEPGTNDPITFSTGSGNTSGSYTLRSSGTYTFGVVVVNDNKIAGKAQCTVTVAPKTYYIKHPFVNKAQSEIGDGDWTWKQLTYNEIDGTYQYKGDNGKGANFHPNKVANINTSASGDKLKEYHIVNPDALNDNDSCIFVYDVTLDTVTVYSLTKRLYRIKSICQDNEYFSNAVTYEGESDPQTVSFFAQKGGRLVWQSRATAADNWVDQAEEVTTSADASGIYTATPTKLQTEFALTAYEGDLTVFSQLTQTGISTGSPTALDGKMTEFTKEYSTDYYNHYWVRYISTENAQAMATVGNSINPCLAITLPYYQMPATGNVRYAYDNTTNHFSRTFLAGSGDQNFLRVYGVHLDTVKISGKDTTYLPIDALNNSRKFNDGSDWIYTANASGEVNATQSVTGILVTKYNNMNRWILAESGLEADPTAERVILNQTVATPGRYNLTLIYDYKTNRLTAGAQPLPGTVITDTMLIDQLILSRVGDESATQFTLADQAKLIVVDKMTVEFDVTKEMWTAWTGNTQGDGSKIMYFWFSVPYECKINAIYGLGVYGEKFEIQRYRGDLRAAGTAGGGQTASAWRKLKNTATMEANRGYVIAMKVKESDFKSATVGGETKSVIRLFFPSVSKVELTHEVKTVLQQNENTKTSNLHWNWNIMGCPLVLDGTGGSIIDSEHEGSAELNYVYVWTWGGGARTYEPWALEDTELQSTHSYMVQGYGDVYWHYPTAKAPMRQLEAAQFASDDSYGKLNIRLNISQDDQLLDKTYIRYREDGDREEYEMGRDLEKIVNSGVTQMYAVTNNNLAAICLSSEDKDMIPLTVIANKDGNYTFSLHRQLNSNLEPTIYDAETGEYTNLSISDYTIDLSKDTYEERFFFLLKKNGIITNVNELNSNNYENGVQKIIMNEQLYIIRDGKIYNATGSVVE